MAAISEGGLKINLTLALGRFELAVVNPVVGGLAAVERLIGAQWRFFQPAAEKI
jgi:hypothetical protein